MALDATERIVNSALRDVQGYFGGKTALAVVNGVSSALAMYFIGVPGALAIGVVNFIGAYIPYIGAFFGGASRSAAVASGFASVRAPLSDAVSFFGCFALSAFSGLGSSVCWIV